MIQAKVVADSITAIGERLTTLEVVMPRYILAEFNTHRILSKNSASSRAIPLLKMINNVKENTFIPIAWQLEHSGMQGTVYLDKTKKYRLSTFISTMIDTLQSLQSNSKEYNKLNKHIEESVNLIDSCLLEYKYMEKTLEEWWLLARDKAIEMASIMYVFNVTKQLANRLLEPFMYHKVLVSGTEWENFFNLRCPEYQGKNKTWKSWKEMLKEAQEDDTIGEEEYIRLVTTDVLTKLSYNKGQADIHMMFLAEAIYDAINESTPRELKEGEWHIPYGDNIDYTMLGIATGEYYINNPTEVVDVDKWAIRISIARCARLSYQTLGDNPVIDYEKDLQLYEVLSTSGHWSPFEHVAKAMSEEEYHITYGTKAENAKGNGWCRNFKGFIQYRDLLD